MTILALSSENYKNLGSYGFQSFKNLNILIGPNGAGKSNLLGLFSFLSDSLISENQDVSGFQVAVDKMGGARIYSVFADTPGYVKLLYKFRGIEETNGKDIYLKIWMFITSSSEFPEIHLEELCSPKDGDPERPFIYYKIHDRNRGSGVVSLPDREYGGNVRFRQVSDLSTRSLVLTSLDDAIRKSEYVDELLRDSDVYKIRQHLIEEIKGWRCYNANNMNLKEIRESEPKIGAATSSYYLSASGTNLIAVIEELKNDSIDFEDRFNEAVESFLPGTRRIRPVRAGRLSLTLEWITDQHSEPLFLTDMSDGSVRMLCWAVILLSHKLPSLLVIDEPEMGLHVAWLKILARWIEYAAQHTTVIIATHSPDLLDCFTESYDSVICFEPNRDGTTQLKSVGESQLKSRLDEGWELGDLYRVGDPSIGAWP